MSLKHIDVNTAHTLQSADDHTYVDVRSIPEFESGHPTGAHNVPLLNRDRQTGQMRPNPDFLTVMQANYPPESKLLIGCQMGGRSAQAGQILVAGFPSSAMPQPSVATTVCDRRGPNHLGRRRVDLLDR